MSNPTTNFYVTTPIYYVNDVPHIGHAYTTILADVLARYHRLLGVPTFFLTGTDEHGQKVYNAAREAGITAQEQTDRTVVRFQEAWKKLEISNDFFIRTTATNHKAVVQEVLGELYEKGDIYADDYEGWYSVSEERFYTEKELVDGRSPEGKSVEKIKERNYFFRMSQYQDWLIGHIEANPDFIQPVTRRNETLGYLKQPLGDLCISRPKSRLPWGVELPFDSDFVCYVWFDALLNYLSGIGYRSDPAQFEKWWPASYHLIGKDILTTHTVYWPIMLRAIGVEMPRAFFAHGWWLLGEEKMSKSVGNVVSPLSMADEYGADSLRYFLMAEMTLGQDATFTEEIFTRRYNSDLANDLGNLTSRVLKTVMRSFDGKIPKPTTRTEAEAPLERACLEAVREMEDHLAKMSLDRGIAAGAEAIREANRYWNQAEPWNLVKAGDVDRLATVIYSTAECLRIVSGLLYPVIPQKMAELRRALGIEESEVEPKIERLREWGQLEPGRAVNDLEALFPRIDTKKRKKPAEPAPKKSKAKTDPSPEKQDGLVDIKEFFQTQLKVARILEAEPVPKSDKLLKLQIDVGDEKRQIVAGIAEYYQPDELVGRSIVVVANLKPAKIRGVESNGMLLATKGPEGPKILAPQGEVAPGTLVG